MRELSDGEGPDARRSAPGFKAERKAGIVPVQRIGKRTGNEPEAGSPHDPLASLIEEWHGIDREIGALEEEVESEQHATGDLVVKIWAIEELEGERWELEDAINKLGRRAPPPTSSLLGCPYACLGLDALEDRYGDARERRRQASWWSRALLKVLRGRMLGGSRTRPHAR